MLLTPTAMIIATETMRPLSRTFTLSGVDPQTGPVALERAVQERLHFSSISAHNRLTWLLEIPVIPIALTTSSTERVETPCT